MTASFSRYLLATVLCFFLGLIYIYGEKADGKFTLVIDAGHGGHDPGALGAYSKEKTINLNVALAFGRLVEENCPDVKVIYTRTRDVFIPLQRRADIANNSKADLFVSIHTNALPAGRIAYGSETYTLGMARANANLAVAKRENSVITLENDYKHTYEGFDPNKAESYVIFEILQDRYMKQSVELARYIQRQYKGAGRADKGVHQAGFLVLRNTTMPSVLTELGFITTPAEETYLNSKEGIAELSRSLYNGFLAYRRVHDRTAHDLPADLPARVTENDQPRFSTKPDFRENPHTAAQTPEQVKPERPAVRPLTRDESPRRASADAVNQENNQTTAQEGNIVYRIQVSAGKYKLRPNDSQFKGLPIVSEQAGDIYRYFTGCYNTFSEATKALPEVQKKMPGSFVVATRNGRLIPFSEVKRTK